MSDLNEEILNYLDLNSSLDTLEYAKSLGLDHQKVIGAVKSLQSQSQDVSIYPSTNFRFIPICMILISSWLLLNNIRSKRFNLAEKPIR